MKYIAHWDSVSKVYTESGIPANFYNDFSRKSFKENTRFILSGVIFCSADRCFNI